MTDPTGATISFAFDANNRLASVSEPNGVTISLTYEAAGNETSVVGKNQTGATLSSYSYTYGKTHLRQSMTDNALGQVNTYHYDSLNHLSEDVVTQGSSQVNDFQYSYDNNGNRSSQTINGVTTTFTYNAASELTSASDGVSYSYDANGNLTQVEAGETLTAAYSYNAKNQMTEFQRASTKLIPLIYTGPDQNERVQKGTTHYVNSPYGVSSQSDGSGTTFFERDNRGNLVSERTPSGTFYYLFDGLGSIVGLTDGNGNLVGNERLVYDPFGNALNNPSSSTNQANPWRFASGYFDGESGLLKFGVRYDDPMVGRWTQQDPMGGSLFDPSSPNRYTYAKCDPVNVTDPSGEVSGSCIFNIIVSSLTIGYTLEFLLGVLFGGLPAVALALGTAALTIGSVFLALLASFIAVILVTYAAYEIATSIGGIIQNCS